jgi:hypothetical protein
LSTFVGGWAFLVSNTGEVLWRVGLEMVTDLGFRSGRWCNGMSRWISIRWMWGMLIYRQLGPRDADMAWVSCDRDCNSWSVSALRGRESQEAQS